jgi:hypothetical protein
MGLHVFPLLLGADVGLRHKSMDHAGIGTQHANELPIFLRARRKRFLLMPGHTGTLQALIWHDWNIPIVLFRFQPRLKPCYSGEASNNSLNRDSPDESRTGVNTRAFAALQQDWSEVWMLTRGLGSPNEGRGADLVIFSCIWTHLMGSGGKRAENWLVGALVGLPQSASSGLHPRCRHASSRIRHPHLDGVILQP